MRSLRCGVATALLISSLATAGETEKVELGRRLFMDRTVSRGGLFSCASCHDPERGFSDPRQFSVDENGKTRRHSQPVVDLDAGQPLHWDGEFGSMRELLTARLASPAEAVAQALTLRTRQFEAARTAGRTPNEPEFRRTISRLTPPYYGPVTGGRRIPIAPTLRLDEDDRYAPLFRATYGSSTVTTDRLIDAIHAYMLTLESGENAYDRYAAGDPSALTPEARRGLALFTGKAECARCHAIGETRRFTDGAFHNTGVAFRDLTLDFGGTGADGGSGEMTFVSADLGKFKTPSLRDVARRAPYMHDGSLVTLADVVGYYNKGGTPNGRLDEHIHPLALTEEESSDLVAFLESLTGDERPGLGPEPMKSRTGHIRVVDLRGRPLRGITVEIEPAGDRLEGGRREPPQLVTTNSEGWFRFEYPAWTHVQLRTVGYEIHYDWLIPDCVTNMTVVAAPLDDVALKVRPPKGMKAPSYIFAYDEEKKVKAGFERVRVLSDRSAIYVAGAHGGTGIANVLGRELEIDLSGGWAEPLDLRPEPQG